MDVSCLNIVFNMRVYSIYSFIVFDMRFNMV